MEKAIFIIGLLLFLIRKNKSSRKALFGEVLGVVFVVALCCFFNTYPNESIYCKVSDKEAVIYVTTAFIWAQVARLI